MSVGVGHLPSPGLDAVDGSIPVFDLTLLWCHFCCNQLQYNWFYQTLAEKLPIKQTLLVVVILVSLASPL
jgi:hypothetical protein